MTATEVLIDGLHFPEAPRWRDGWLWFSDIYGDSVGRVSAEGKFEELFDVAGRPSGLGWLPDGRLLVVSMSERRVLRREADGRLVEHADLSGIATWDCNDMLVDAAGRAYVGNFGSEPALPKPPSPASLALVLPDGAVREAAPGLVFANGCVLTPDGGTLIVSETFGARLSAFDVAPDGSLAHRRVWAERAGLMPDGCCLDAAGGIWVASPMSDGEVVRILEGGEITHRIRARKDPFACMLGGDDRRTLFICSAENADEEHCRNHATGAIEIARVEWPGAGLP